MEKENNQNITQELIELEQEFETPNQEEKKINEEVEVEEIEESIDETVDENTRLDMETELKKNKVILKKFDALAKFSGLSNADELIKQLEQSAVEHKAKESNMDKSIVAEQLNSIKNANSNEELWSNYIRTNIESTLQKEYGVSTAKAKNMIKEAELNLNTSIRETNPTVFINQIKGTHNLVHVNVQKKVNANMIKQNKAKETKLNTSTSVPNIEPERGKLPSAKGVINAQKITIASANSLFNHYVEEGYSPQQALDILEKVPKFRNLVKNNLIGET